MKGNKLTLAPLSLLLGWMLLVDSARISFIFTLQEESQIIPMTMVENAVDDMYFTCNGTMSKMIQDKYFTKENTGKFAKVWKNAERCAKKKLNDKDTVDKALNKDHMQAICVYTSEYEQFYSIFNEAVRTKMSEYNTSFRFHYLHFWLTSAIQILNNNMNCHTTYRRTKAEFSGKVNQIVRFGYFTSSSYDTTLTRFGTKTCFKIKTCSGAYLKHYSTLRENEQEVLIPPYEKFKITGKEKGEFVKGLDDCEVVYFLESTGIQSNLNCKAAYE
ncbi:erythroblast NAD(P)(+)--arginine ADP-ribosyltransferase-like [Scomber scombrus]|uniref:NAD(P)(+)--arginine ADP-ribosyltransferase n=2 Tax=Scomber scombrus TaxID=13677 RepID=A0AAV1N2Y4_SCOSC